jgi:S1-C subfamily serine protease
MRQLPACILLFAGCFHFVLKAQETTVFLDIQEKITEKKFAYYTRSILKDSAGYSCIGMQFLNGKSYFEGCVLKLDPNGSQGNVYVGQCKWYFRSGQLKTLAYFNAAGKLDGQMQEWDEDGALLKTVNYTDGEAKLDSTISSQNAQNLERIFNEPFDNNDNDWDLFVTPDHSAEISNGVLKLSSSNPLGTARFIRSSISSSLFEINLTIEPPVKKSALLKGLIFDFKDWNNYRYFFLHGDYFSIGSVDKGEHRRLADLMTSVAITPDKNVLAVENTLDKCNYIINGKTVFKAKTIELAHDKVGCIMGGKGIAEFGALRIKEDLSIPATKLSDETVRGTGSGFLIDPSGYFITNYHVIEKSNRIFVELPALNATFEAREVISDKTNDLALLQITDSRFKFDEQIVFSFLWSVEDVGTEVFTLGYPFVLSGLGREVKFADGKVSSRTGFDNNVALYQTTVPIQPGNSGSPLFNNQGQIVGCVNAIYKNADNVSYAIKSSFIRTLVESSGTDITIPQANEIQELPLTEKIKLLSKYIGIIKVL